MITTIVIMIIIIISSSGSITHLYLKIALYYGPFPFK